MPPIRLSAMARKTRKGRIRDISIKDAATRRKLRGWSSSFCPKEPFQARLVEAHADDLFLRDEHAPGRRAAGLAHVLAPGPGHFHAVRAAKRGEMGGEERRVAQRARVG